MSLILVQHGDYDIFNCTGNLKVGLLPQISPQLSKHIQTNPDKDLIIDLSGTGFIDSSALRLFVNLHKKLESTGKRLCLLAPSPFVLKIIEDVKLSLVFTIYSNLDEFELDLSKQLRSAFSKHTTEEDGHKKLKCVCPVCGSTDVHGYFIDECDYWWEWESDDPFPSGFSKPASEPVDVFALLPIVCAECYMCSIDFSHFSVRENEKTVIPSRLGAEVVHQLSKAIKTRKKLMESCVVIGDRFFDHPREKIAVYHFYLLAEICMRLCASGKVASAPFLMGYVNYLATKYSPPEKRDEHIGNTRTWLNQVLAESKGYRYADVAKSYFILFMVAISLKKPKEAAKLFDDFSGFLKTIPASKYPDTNMINSPNFWYGQAEKIFSKEIKDGL
jgi:anti-sigma B factor antagonist